MSFNKFKKWSMEDYEAPKIIDTRPIDPLNVRLLKLTDSQLSHLKPVTSTQILVPSSRTLHPEGLYSTDIFGQKGSDERKSTFAYIDLKVSIINPAYYGYLVGSKGFYDEIMAGKSYAVFNQETNDFDPASRGIGNTGFQFFISHFNELVVPETGSEARKILTMLKDDQFDKLLISHLLVLPAGLRDVDINDEGRVEDEDEINGYYWNILSLSNSIPEGVFNYSPESIDTLRYRLQVKAYELYNYLFQATFGGKNKFALGKWGYRAIRYGVRNVLSTMINNTTELHGELAIKPTESAIGIYQFIKMIGPLAIHNIVSYLAKDTFMGSNAPANLINTKTFKSELVYIDPTIYDQFMTQTGADNFIDRFRIEDLRHSPLMANGYYLYLIYKDNESFMVLKDIDDLPSHLEPTKVYPMTIAEFMFITMYDSAKRIPTTNTRYPVANVGGAYPSFICMKSTVDSIALNELDRDGKTIIKRYLHFPIVDTRFYDVDAPHSSHLAAQGADHDGDMKSTESLMTDESIDEINKLVHTATFYVSPTGGALYSFNTDVKKLVMQHLTGKVN